MLKYIEGDIFNSPAQVLVNTVNTVGVMGKGIALSFKKLYPDIVVGEDEELRIQGLAVGVYHKFGKADVEDENDDE